jgi:repressor LexA
VDALTEIQRRVFEFVRDTLASGGPAPTPREIAATFGWSSKRAAECHIEALMRKGWLTSEAGKARSLRLADSLQKGNRSVFELPVLGTIPAGFGNEREQETGEWVQVTVGCIGFKPTRNMFALRVSGDSMVGRHICDGDLVVLERGPAPRPGQVVAALIDRENTLKTFVIKNGRPFLKAENPRYPNLIPSEELLIQGVMCALMRQIAS